MSRVSVCFGCGVALALLAGWLVFPRILYTRQRQPVAFRHQTHAAKSGTAECASCHALQADGEFAGIPKIETCAPCHAEPMGTSPAEATLVKDYVKTGRETPWLVYTRQPANVRFSHAIHTTRAALACKTCHDADGTTDQVPTYEQNRISGYSRHVMSMAECEDCHRARGFDVGCLGCHQ